MSEISRCAYLQHGWNASTRSRVGVGMNGSARGAMRVQRSNGLDTALYTTHLYLVILSLLSQATSTADLTKRMLCVQRLLVNIRSTPNVIVDSVSEY